MPGKYIKSFDESKIYYEIFSQDKHVEHHLVFLHGFGGSLNAWKKERDFFQSLGYSTIALDLRGHGFSQRGKDLSFYKLENFAKDVLAILEEEKIQNASLIGHCFGGVVSMQTVALNSKYTSNLVLVDTGYKAPFLGNKMERSILKGICDLLVKILPDIKISGHADFNKFMGTGDLNIRRVISDMLHTSFKSYFLLSKIIADLDAKNLLTKIHIPTLVIGGSKDTIFPPKMAEYLQERINKSELEIIQGANHILVINNPEDLSKTILSFLKKNLPLEKNVVNV